MPGSKWVETQWGRPVVKALNTIVADGLLQSGRPLGDPNRVALPVSGTI